MLNKLAQATLKATSQRLAQLQSKLDSDGSITRKDIATLLQQGNVGLARAKALKLIHEDAQGDLMENIENEIGTLVTHFQELYTKSTPTPVVAEALSSIIHTAPHIPCKGNYVELQSLSHLFAYRFGPDFARSALTNRDEHVSPRITRILAAPEPTASGLNNYLVGICRTYRVEWVPDPGRCDVVNVLSEIMNPGEGKDVDMIALRRFCSYVGIPDEPSWLRPRIWKLFLGLVPVKQDSETREVSRQRDCYYDLVRQLLEPYTSLPEPSTSAHPSDATLLNIVHHLSRIPRELFAHLEVALEGIPPCPLSEASDETIRIPHASALDKRLRALKDYASTNTSSSPDEATPAISISNYDSSAPDTESTSVVEPTFPRAYRFGDAHPHHCSAILRLLFIHAAINPGQFSPHIPALLVPLYTALHLEVAPEELAHVEADTFWLFQEMVAEFSDVDEGEGSQKWMLKLDHALSQADPELHDSLRMKGLRPSLPHYSYRWLAPVLTYTIPVPALFIIWDVLFCCPRRERENHPKLELLVDLACSMILALRKELLSLGHRTGAKANDRLWSNDDSEAFTSTNDPFLEGMTLLQAYPRTSIQDVDRIVQTANDLVKRRELAQSALLSENAPAQAQTGLGARLRHTMWKGFTNQIDDEEPSPENSGSDRERSKDDGNETERPSESSTTKSWWTSIAPPILTVSAAEDCLPVPPPDDDVGYASSSSKASGIWSYAEKLRDSDTAASLAKVGTNWRARALTVGTSWTQKKPAEIGQSPSISGSSAGRSNFRPTSGERTSIGMKAHLRSRTEGSPASPSYSPTHSRNGSSPHSSDSSSSPQTADDQGPDEFGFVDKTKALLSLRSRSAASTLSKSSKPKAGPRPLLLNSASPITSPATKETTPDSSQWTEVMKAKKRYLDRDARSSISSLSPSEALKTNRSDWESDTGSRLVALNRRSVSPMAPSYRVKTSSRSATSEPFSPSALSASTSASIPLQSAPATTSRAPALQLPPSRASTTLPRLETTNGEGATRDMLDSPSQSGPALSRHGRVHSRRSTKPARLQLKDSPLEHKIAASNLTVEWPANDGEVVTTPRAMTFDTSADEGTNLPSPISPRLRRRKVSTDRSSSRKPSGDSQEPRIRKTSSRSRKLSSSEQKDAKKHIRRDSAAEEGDDEGYDDLLSAYESEDLGPKQAA
ncbi:regulator of Vps4 activity in the MVB pathway-domain-containing protein [Coprinopsis sp. MPI-PUGE-AT-0042]|nr:regulator of Vps4 activity in the MVB pathway-domain-containing protein [Coprinopsis sp. MPI-PUGE-AT-0042]